MIPNIFDLLDIELINLEIVQKRWALEDDPIYIVMDEISNEYEKATNS